MHVHFSHLLRPEIFVLKVDHPPMLILKEEGSQSALKKLKIYNPPDDCAAFQLDPCTNKGLKGLKQALKQLSWLIHASHQNANKKCDLVVVWKTDDDLNVLLLDLKSEGAKDSDCQKQLRNSELFVSFLLDLLKEYHGITGTIRYKKAIVRGIRPLLVKAPANQRNRIKPSLRGDIRYIDVAATGRDNSEGTVDFRELWVT